MVTSYSVRFTYPVRSNLFRGRLCGNRNTLGQTGKSKNTKELDRQAYAPSSLVEWSSIDVPESNKGGLGSGVWVLILLLLMLILMVSCTVRVPL